VDGVEGPEPLHAVGPRASQYGAGDVHQEQAAHRLPDDVRHPLTVHPCAQQGSTDFQQGQLAGHQLGVVRLRDPPCP
jgi:hypothetical protein